MTEHATLSVALVSGKGGVGKTNIALNLAYALYRAKQRVLLMDCDIGLANLDVLLGIAPKVSIEQVMLGEAAFEEAIVGIEPGSFSLLPAASGMEALGEESFLLRSSFVAQLNHMARQYDYLLLDIGAGITDTVRAFAVRAAMRLLIITPEPTSITDAYALIKVLVTQYGLKDFHVLVNQAESAAEEKRAFSRLAAAAEKFLGISLHSLGGIRYDSAMQQAVRRQEPLLRFAPTSPAGKDLIAAAVRVHTLRESMALDPDAALRDPEQQHMRA